MRGAGWAERAYPGALALAACGLLALTARAEVPSGAMPTASGMPRASDLAVVRYKLLALEQRRFDQQFPLTGALAGEAIRALREAGYTCVVDGPASSGQATDSAPGVACRRRSTAADDVCQERMVRLAIDGLDARASADGLDAQLGTRRVAHRVFRCDAS